MPFKSLHKVKAEGGVDAAKAAEAMATNSKAECEKAMAATKSEEKESASASAIASGYAVAAATTPESAEDAFKADVAAQNLVRMMKDLEGGLTGEMAQNIAASVSKAAGLKVSRTKRPARKRPVKKGRVKGAKFSAEEIASRRNARRPFFKGNPWHLNFGVLKRYKEIHGNCDPPQICTFRDDGHDFKIGTWVNKQREDKKRFLKGEKTSFTQEKSDLLESIGFRWAASKGEKAWERQFDELMVFKAKYGHCKVPTRPDICKTGDFAALTDEERQTMKTLGRWVTTQRSSKKKGEIDADKERRLNEIGFVWKGEA